MARVRRRTQPTTLEDRLATNDPAVWTTPAERDRVAALLVIGGEPARAELLDLGAAGPPVLDVGQVLDDTTPPPPLLPMRGAALTAAAHDVVSSIVDARRVAAVREWVDAAGFPARGPGWRRLADAVIADRFGVDMTGQL